MTRSSKERSSGNDKFSMSASDCKNSNLKTCLASYKPGEAGSCWVSRDLLMFYTRNCSAAAHATRFVSHLDQTGDNDNDNDNANENDSHYTVFVINCEFIANNLDGCNGKNVGKPHDLPVSGANIDAKCEFNVKKWLCCLSRVLSRTLESYLRCCCGF